MYEHTHTQEHTPDSSILAQTWKLKMKKTPDPTDIFLIPYV